MLRDTNSKGRKCVEVQAELLGTGDNVLHAPQLHLVRVISPLMHPLITLPVSATFTAKKKLEKDKDVIKLAVVTYKSVTVCFVFDQWGLLASDLQAPCFLTAHINKAN